MNRFQSWQAAQLGTMVLAFRQAYEDLAESAVVDDWGSVEQVRLLTNYIEAWWSMDPTVWIRERANKPPSHPAARQ